MLLVFFDIFKDKI
jgi:site-specific DNA recombinase